MSSEKVFSDAVPFTFYEQSLGRMEGEGDVCRIACLSPLVMQGGVEEVSHELPLWQLLCAVTEHRYRSFFDKASIEEYAPDWNRIPHALEHVFLYAPCHDSDTHVFEGHFSRHENPFTPSVARADVSKRICIEADVGFIFLHKY